MKKLNVNVNGELTQATISEVRDFAADGAEVTMVKGQMRFFWSLEKNSFVWPK